MFDSVSQSPDSCTVRCVRLVDTNHQKVHFLAEGISSMIYTGSKHEVHGPPSQKQSRLPSRVCEPMFVGRCNRRGPPLVSLRNALQTLVQARVTPQKWISVFLLLLFKTTPRRVVSLKGTDMHVLCLPVTFPWRSDLSGGRCHLHFPGSGGNSDHRELEIRSPPREASLGSVSQLRILVQQRAMIWRWAKVEVWVVKNHRLFVRGSLGCHRWGDV